MSENQGTAASVDVKKGMSLFGVVLLCAITGAASTAASYVMIKKNVEQSPTARVVVVDTQKIIDQKARDFGRGNASPEQVTAEARLFSEKMQKKVSELVSAGLIVVNKRAVIGQPKSVDLTREFAHSVGVNLDESK